MGNGLAGKGQQTYERVLATARDRGDAKDYRHLDGWRGSKNAEIMRLYRAGKVTVALAVKHGAKPKDHLAAIDAGVVDVLDIVKAGVDLEALARVRKAQETRAEMTPKKMAKRLEKLRAENQALKAANVKATVTINGQEVVQPKIDRPLSAHDTAIARAVFEAQEREKAKKTAERRGKHGYTVTLTDTQRQELTARNAAKGKPEW